ncbi:WapI family immunity protein [Paenibacillus tundrae]|uniref:Uncharacterized protein n=1 Tax=Paenibacillus tundrae TaxID=528187 RepID=A0ABT9WH48_9BACL|nr:hypothetical protein [Paenibacillus tundrae]MDQ0172399.1 hypothetical protein [Paenibacillus tundrae]
MPIITNNENNLTLTINLINNKFMDVDSQRESFENWIPFSFCVEVENRQLCFLEDSGATLSLFEINLLTNMLKDITQQKQLGAHIKRHEFSSSECYFDLIFSETFEENLVYLEVWINMGSYSGGVSFGYDKGFRFVVTVENLIEFMIGINVQLNEIISDLNLS